MIDPTQHIHETFTEHKDSIVLLCEKDPEFRSLCRDFDDCVDAFRHWKNSADPEGADKAREYLELLGALHAEILQLLAGGPDSSRS